MAPAEVPEMASISQPRLLEQAIEDAPGKGAVGAASLQGEVDQQRIAVGLLASIGDRHRSSPVADPRVN